MQRVDRQGSSDAEKAYSISMMNDLKIGIEANQDNTGPMAAPSTNKWNRVLYGPSEAATLQTQDLSKTNTTVSTITQVNSTQQSPGLEEKLKELEATTQTTQKIQETK